MNRNEGLDDHQKFKELAALERVGALSESERLALRRHLKVCSSCQQASDEYALIGTEGMSLLAAACGHSRESEAWDDRQVRNKLMARVRAEEQPRTAVKKADLLHIPRRGFAIHTPSRWVVTAVAACVLVAVALGAYHLGGRTVVAERGVPPAPSPQLQNVVFENNASDQLIASQKAQLSRLQTQVSSGQQEITKLREALHAAEVYSATLSTENSAGTQELRRVSEERDKLAGQLRDAEQSYQLVQAELTTLRAEHDRVLLRTTSLESKIDELTASAHDQERRLKDDEQYLSSDRDIRELMGARKLYIADVFDVDSGSRTRKPFGRVFYTESKSLIFYAFDLDHEPGVKNASAFQVWGQRDTESGQKNHAMNLGILYMDSDSNRRWVLRLDDPKQLAEIDAVFVTVEPHGGSQKPTGKPFLYALLRREANHP
jgi:hypothetical protein